MKTKIYKILIFALAAVLLFGTLSASAYTPYLTYTYSSEGEIVESPMAYYPYDTVSADTELGIKKSQKIFDMVTDENGYIYISCWDDTDKRVVVLDASYKYIGEISRFTDKYGKEQTFGNANGNGGPEGLFVSRPNDDGESYIYVCDPENKRVVMFNRDLTYHDTIDEPESKIIKENTFRPKAIAVDKYGRMFITSGSSSQGIFVLSPAGDFNGFIGAQKVVGSFFDQLLNKIFNNRYSSTGEATAPAYSNITIDNDGFIYATITFTKSAELSNQKAALTSKDSTFSPVKKYNSKGTEILARNGFFDPAGEVDVFMADEVSMLTDIAVGAEGAWTVFDKSRSRTYTYDQQGNLLYAFGDMSDQLGNLIDGMAMCYQVVNGEYRLLIMDNSVNAKDQVLNIYTPTGYANAITNALANENNHNYSESIDAWQDVLTENNNLDLAYIGMGRSYYFQGKYDEAMEKLKGAYDTQYYSLAYAEGRNEIVSKWLIPIVALIIVLAVLIVKFLGYAKKKNKATSLKVGKKTYWEELIFAFHLIFHPFDGFWDLKHERRGSVRAASTILGLTILAFFYQSIGRGYMFAPKATEDTIITQILSIGMPVLLWVVSNWCLTTLFDGEGSIKDIYITTCYSLTPLPIFVTVSTILSNVLTLSEKTIVDMFVYVAVVWMIILLFFGTVVTHDYTIGKNVITTVATIVAAAVIIFIALLFATLVGKMGSLVTSLYNEIVNRL